MLTNAEHVELVCKKINNFKEKLCENPSSFV